MIRYLTLRWSFHHLSLFLLFQFLVLIDSFLRHGPFPDGMPQRIAQRQLIMVGIEGITSSFVPISLTFSIPLEVLSLRIAHGRNGRIQLTFLFGNPKNFFERFFLITVIDVTRFITALDDIAKNWSFLEERLLLHLWRRMRYLVFYWRALSGRRREHRNALALFDDQRALRQEVIFFMQSLCCWHRLFLVSLLDAFCWFWFL